MNGSVCSFGNGGFMPPNRSQRFFAFKNDDILFWETGDQNAFWFNDGSNFPNEGISRRHISGAVLGHMDSSVSFMKLDVYNALQNNPVKNALWCNPRSANGR